MSNEILVPLKDLHVSPFNMRAEKKVPSLKRMAEISASILPTVREKGVQTPLIVRRNNSGLEILAGRRRFYAATVVASETDVPVTLRCDLRENITDAEALEISAIENAGREDPDEITNYETFNALIHLGRTPAEIAKTFGKEVKEVLQCLAIANLMPPIRELYRESHIEVATLRLLTMATKTQQRDWLKLYGQREAPYGSRLKNWLFGGSAVAAKFALFDAAPFKEQIVDNLFGDEGYFSDAKLFWTHQDQAIAARRDAYLAAKWAEVVILDRGAQFQVYDYVKAPKKDGGRVYIEPTHTGEVRFHEGYLGRREVEKAIKQAEKAKAAKKGAKGEDEAPSRSPITSAMQNYLDLHRHAAVRLAVLARPKDAIKLLIAHAVASSGNWSVHRDSQSTRSDDLRKSIAASPAQAAFEAEAKKVFALLAPAFKEAGARANGRGNTQVSGLATHRPEVTFAVFERLLKLKDAEVARVAAFVMAETLAAGSDVTDAFGAFAKLETRKHWSPDPLFFELIRDRQTANTMLAGAADKKTADRMVTAKLKEQKATLLDAAAKNAAWCPAWMAFAPASAAKH